MFYNKQFSVFAGSAFVVNNDNKNTIVHTDTFAEAICVLQSSKYELDDYGRCIYFIDANDIATHWAYIYDNKEQKICCGMDLALLIRDNLQRKFLNTKGLKKYTKKYGVPPKHYGKLLSEKKTMKHSRKPYPGLYYVSDLIKSANECQAGIILNKETPEEKMVWVPARPMGFQSWLYRWKYAWMVFQGKADALIWDYQ